MDEPLDAVGVRVLGSLLEKELTTPDNYPLTLNALVAACNQTSSRDPVMELDEATVSRTLRELRGRGLVGEVRREDARVLRYRQEMGELLHLHRPELAVLSVLLLRGPQTPGEIKSRAARAFEFVDASHVEITLDSLATLSTPLVTALARRPGQKEVRYVHLLAGAPGPDSVERATDQGEMPSGTGGGSGDRVEALEVEVRSLRQEVDELRARFDAFRRQFE